MFARRQANQLKVKVENLERQLKQKDVDHKKVKDLQEFTNNLLLVKEREFRDLRDEHSNLLNQFENVQKSESEARGKSNELAATNEILDQEVQSFQIATKNDLKEKQDQNAKIGSLKSTIQKVDQRCKMLMVRKTGLKENLQTAEHTIQNNLLKLKEKEKKISNLESLACDKDLQLVDCKKRCRELETRSLSYDFSRGVDSGYEKRRDLILEGMKAEGRQFKQDKEGGKPSEEGVDTHEPLS